jgi:alkanesulfonate monooxygenase SsuD/methylene tetrahydromethanopterin reductase-like flavin-dependent oxidoreductase (luciferase family)
LWFITSTHGEARHLVVTASAISSIDELSGGRAILGLGSGDSGIYTLGAPPSTVAGLEEAVVTLGRLTSGAVVERGGQTALKSRLDPEPTDGLQQVDPGDDIGRERLAGVCQEAPTKLWAARWIT